MKELEQELRRRFPVADIRSDQCNIVRMISSRFVAGCTKENDHFEAKIISLEGDVEFDTELVATFVEQTPKALADRLGEFF